MIIASPSQALAAPAAITLSPEDGEVGDTIAIQGSGFTPLSEISIEFDGDSITTDPPTVQADDLGEFMAEFAIPPGTSAATIMIEAADNSANATTASSEFIVLNTPPVADEQPPIEIGENGSELISLTASDVNGDTLTLEIIDIPSHGTLSEFDEDTGEVVYEPEEGYAGPDSFSFKANDGVGDSSATVISLTIVSAGEPPVVSDFEVGASEDSQLSITLNATDPDSPSASFVIVSEPDHGTLGELDEISSFSSKVVYTPDPNYNGQDSFTFKAYDGASYSEIGEATIAIAGASDSPVATAKSVTVKEDSKKKITLEASDADGDPLSYSIVSDPDHGNLTGIAPALYYEPDEGYTGHDSFRFMASDSSSNSNIATVTIAVGVEEEEEDEDYYYYEEEDYYEEENGYDPANTRPVAYSQSVSGTEDTPITITLTADDVNGDFLTFGIVDYPSFGEISDLDDGTGQLTYTPAAEYGGTDSFTFTAMDDHRESKKETVSISIEPVNDPPSPISMNLTAAEGTVSITLGAFDVEGDALQYALYSEPSNGVLSGTAPELVYSADPGFNGYDKFLFTVSDSRPDGRIGVVSIQVGEPEPDGGNTTYSESGEGADSETSDSQEDGDIDSGDSNPGGESDSGMPDSDPEGESTTIARADKSKVLVMVSWEHENQDQGVESKLHLEFAEHRTRAPLGTHIWYDLVMLDDSNNEIVRMNDLIALDSEDTQMISFPAEGTYHFEVNVKGLIDKSNNAITRHTDYTGTALGTVVVPELDSMAILIVITAIMGSAIAAMRHRALQIFQTNNP